MKKKARNIGIVGIVPLMSYKSYGMVDGVRDWGNFTDMNNVKRRKIGYIRI